MKHFLAAGLSLLPVFLLTGICQANAQQTPFEIKISFRPGNDPAPEGFLSDNGKDFGPKETLSYGWVPGTSRDVYRKGWNDNPVLACGVKFYPNSEWQIALENARYAVSLCVGSYDDETPAYPLSVQGVPFLEKYQTGKNVYIKQTKTVEVTDGKLTLRMDEKRRPKGGREWVPIDFIEVRRVEQPMEGKTLVCSVESDPETDRQFYTLAADIRSTSKPTENLPHTLWYTRPAKIWEEGVPLGNGRLGAVVYGDPVRERIQLNEDTLWNGTPGLPFANPDGKKYIDEARQMIFEGKPNREVWDFIFEKVFHHADGQFGPFMFDYMNGGDLILSFPKGPIEKYYRALDLSKGIATTSYERDGVVYKQEVFASAERGVLVVRLTGDKPGSLTLNAEGRDGYGASIVAEGKDTIVINGKAPEKKKIPGVIRYQRRMKFLPQGGTISSDGKKIAVNGADAVTILISIRTNFIKYDDLRGDPEKSTRCDIENAEAVSYDDLRAAHVGDHRRLYDRMSIDLGKATTLDLPTDERIRRFRESGDPHMAALVFQFGRYLMISCSRPGTQAANLQGIWNEWYYGAWGGKYTVNINIQMIYWLAEVGNLSECHESFLRLISEVADTGRATAKAYYGARGWVCHHNTDVWRYNHPIDGTAGMWPTASAWFCDHIWEHYAYTLDKEFLRRMYPVMRDAALFYVDSLVTDPRNGYLVTAPSFSPENKDICAAPAMDVGLLQSLFVRTIEAAKILGVDEELQKQFEATRQKLPPLKIGKWKQLQEWPLADVDDPNDKHRHVSHLYALHPGDQITPWKTPELFEASKVSLLARGDEATGWSMGWKVNFWARLRDGDHAYVILRNLIRPSYRPERYGWDSGLYPNFFDAHPPFQIDGNFGAAAGILEMLIQSQNGEIDLLPALPSVWPAGNVTGMRVRGGFEVDLSWKDGKPLRLTVRSKGGTECQVRYGSKVIPLTVANGGTKQLDFVDGVPMP